MKIITIDREFGAGGHTVGKKVAERLGIEIYDKDIIRRAAVESGISAEQLEREEERISKGETILNAIIPVSYDMKDIIFENESKVIREFAQQGPCVILGRCANAVLADAGVDKLSVFLYADPEERVPAVGRLLGLSDHDAILTVMAKKDRQRKSYYEYYTDRHWGSFHEYDLCLNTATLGMDYCVDIICGAVGK